MREGSALRSTQHTTPYTKILANRQWTSSWSIAINFHCLSHTHTYSYIRTRTSLMNHVVVLFFAAIRFPPHTLFTVSDLLGIRRCEYYSIFPSNTGARTLRKETCIKSTTMAVRHTIVLRVVVEMDLLIFKHAHVLLLSFTTFFFLCFWFVCNCCAFIIPRVRLT